MGHDFILVVRLRRRARPRAFALVLAVLVVLFSLVAFPAQAAPTTAASAATFAYDFPAIARVDTREFVAAAAGPAQIGDVGVESAPPPSSARGTSPTSSSRSFATDSAEEAALNAASKATEAADIGSANFAQKTAGASFSAEGAFAGASRAEIVTQLRSGALTAADVQVEVIVRNGQTLILTTRSATALAEAGIPRSAWSVVNVTGDAAAEARLTAQLARNGLTEAGTPTVRAK